MGRKIITNLTELTKFLNIMLCQKCICIDVETNSKNKIDYMEDRICGIAISDYTEYIYIPYRHTLIKDEIYTNLNFSPKFVQIMNKFFKEIQKRKIYILNHNLLFDLMMLSWDFKTISSNTINNYKFHDTIILTHLYDNSRKGNKPYALKTLAWEFCDLNNTSEQEIKAYKKKHREIKTYADIPIEMLGEYAMDDLYMTCLLYTSPSPRDLSTSRMPSSA